MAAINLVRASTRVAMVWPETAIVHRDVVDLRAEPTVDSELVDQAHLGENVRVLGADGDWRYVQGADQYFGWTRVDDLDVMDGYGEAFVIAVLLADVREAPRTDAAVISRLPTGTLVRPIYTSIQQPDGSSRRIEDEQPAGWREARLGRGRRGYVVVTDLVDINQLPHRPPTAADYLKTAESFIGVPYLWGGTTALGLDCSGLVQQVYRLNGVALPRDADQQAMLGRRVEEARAGDLMFFGAERVMTHVALATSPTEFIHAPMMGAVVEHSRLGDDRKLLGIRRYLPDVSTA